MGLNASYFTSGTRLVTLVTYPVISHKRKSTGLWLRQTLTYIDIMVSSKWQSCTVCTLLNSETILIVIETLNICMNIHHSRFLADTLTMKTHGVHSSSEWLPTGITSEVIINNLSPECHFWFLKKRKTKSNLKNG